MRMLMRWRAPWTVQRRFGQDAKPPLEAPLHRAVSHSLHRTLAAILLVTAACGGGSDTPTTPTPTPTPAITLSVASTTAAITAGASGTVNVTLARSGGFTGDVGLTLEDETTAGVTGTFAPATLPNGTTGSVLTLNVASTAASGTGTVTVRARGTGVTDQTAAIALTISAAPVPAFTLGVTAATLSVQQGASGTFKAGIVRSGGFTGTIAVAVTGQPTGVTVTPTPASLTGDTSIVTVAVAAGTAVGTYPLTITGTGTGVTAKTATVTLTVTAAPAGSYTLAVAPTTVSFVQGGTSSATVNLTRLNGFAGAVGLAITGAPAGLTATLASASTTGTSVGITLAATAAVAPGTYPLTITGTSAGLADQTATLSVTITAAPVAGTYTIAVAPASVTFAPTGGATATVNLTRVNGFAGAVGLAITGAPAGLTATLASASTTGNSVGVTLTSTAALAVGTYPLTITGTSAGLTNQTATLTVIVAAAGSFTISVPATPITLTRGQTTTVTVDIVRTGGFTGGVDITVPNLPAGVTATIAPVAGSIRAIRTPLAPTGPSRDVINTGKATITLSASATAATGPFTLGVSASAPGYPTQTATGGTVTVATAPTPGTGNTVFTFCDINNLPIYLAFQDGTTGAWTQVAGASNVYRFDITQGKGGVAFTTLNSGAYTTTVYYGTAAELTAYGSTQCVGGTTVTKTVTGSVAGLVAGVPFGDQANIGTTGSAATVTTNGPFTLTNVPDGTRDFLAARVAQAISGTGLTGTLNKLIIRRGINPTGALAAFDFNSAEAFNPTTATATINNGNGDLVSLLLAYQTQSTTTNASTVSLYSDAVTGGSRTIYTVPAAQQRAGDLHYLAATAITVPSGTSIPTNTSTRTVSRFFSASANQTLNFGPALNAPTTSSVTGGMIRFRVQSAVQAGYDKLYVAQWYNTTPSRSITLLVTSGYTGGAAWDLTIPDLTTAGFNATWGLQSGSAVGSNFTGEGFDFPATTGGYLTADGGTVTTATRTTTPLGVSLSRVPPTTTPSFLRRPAGLTNLNRR